jgi:MSHA biogenesis protein MshL
VGATAAWVLLFASAIQTQQAPAPAQMPPLPLTQLDQRGAAADLDARAFTLTFAQPVPVTDLLLLIVRGTSLSVVPEPSATGSFIGELKNVTVRQALDLILPPLGLSYAVDGSFIRVFKGTGQTRIFDINYIAAARSGASAVTAAGPAGRSTATVSTSTQTDVFDDVAAGVRTLLSKDGAYNVDRTAGLLQVTDAPERLDRVAQYLDAIHERVHRQAQIDVRVLDVELADTKAAGIDWDAVASRIAAPIGGAQPAVTHAAFTGMRLTDLSRLTAALAAQGSVSVLGSQRLLTLNNEPAMVRTETAAFSVTPRIAGDASFLLSVTPLLTAPSVIEADMLARVADGETLVLRGFTRDREHREQKNSGWFRRETVVTHRTIETVILLTPKIVTGIAAE